MMGISGVLVGSKWPDVEDIVAAGKKGSKMRIFLKVK